MNATATKALLLDAVFQVLDNWVFRILVVIGSILVLSTFAFGFREEEIVLLFGVQSWSYESIFTAFTGSSARVDDPQGILINGILDFVFGTLAGNLGVIFCIAATSFFVPQMIEKGAADVLFHKPLNRLTFYLARYFAGLFFVGVLATLMAFGMYAGFLLISGYNDPGILLAAPLLTYLFALIYAVSMFIGVMTRSTVASILLSVIFFAFNGCVHLFWTSMQANEFAQLEELREEAESEEDVVVEEEEDEEGGFALELVKKTNAVLHYVLPKTSDADVLSSKLRKALNAPLYTEEEALISVFLLPDGFEETSPRMPDVPSDVAALLGEPRFQLEGLVEGEAVTCTLLRRAVVRREVERRGELKLVQETASRAGSTLAETLEDTVAEDVDRSLKSFGSNLRGRPMTGSLVRWTGGGQALVVKGAASEWMFTLWIEDAGPDTEARADLTLATIGLAMGYDVSANSYEERFTFTAPWRYNIFFSVGSSLAFVAVLLCLGWWKLSRIEF